MKCWMGYSHRAHQRQKLERCDAHWHRPKRADWRAKAYARSATRPCASVVELYALFGRACWYMRPAIAKCRDDEKLYEASSHKALCSARRLGA